LYSTTACYFLIFLILYLIKIIIWILGYIIRAIFAFSLIFSSKDTLNTLQNLCNRIFLPFLKIVRKWVRKKKRKENE
jgi:uncharacterized protein YggT (Ycf19 family)